MWLQMFSTSLSTEELLLIFQAYVFVLLDSVSIQLQLSTILQTCVFSGHQCVQMAACALPCDCLDMVTKNGWYRMRGLSAVPTYSAAGWSCALNIGETAQAVRPFHGRACLGVRTCIPTQVLMVEGSLGV